ncbi:MAG TPA: hypothetical protein VEB59_00895 [Gemmatimonadales bacterium]|nr:hypothetical protein [Gemmatimonadales bacterium]
MRKDETVSVNGPDRLRFYRGEVGLEHELASSRLNALISSQSFLVLSYATVMAQSIGRWHNPLLVALLPALALLGLLLCYQAWRGIRAANAIAAVWRERERELLEEDAEARAYMDPTDAVSGPSARGLENPVREGARFRRVAPAIFAAAWVYLAVLSLVLYFRG